MLSGRSSFCLSWWDALLVSSPLPHGPSVGIQSPVYIMKAFIDLTDVLEWETACFYASVWVCAGPVLWIGGNGRATPCDVGTDGVFPHGVRIIQAVPVHWQPKEPPQPVVHLPRASLSRKHGLEAEAYQDSDPYPCQKCIQIILRKDNGLHYLIWIYTNSTYVFVQFFFVLFAG